jgi:hypothetical protein
MPVKFYEKPVESGAGDIGKRTRWIPAIYDLGHRRKMVEGFPDYAQNPLLSDVTGRNAGAFYRRRGLRRPARKLLRVHR